MCIVVGIYTAVGIIKSVPVSLFEKTGKANPSITGFGDSTRTATGNS